MPSTEPAPSTTEAPRRATRLSLYKLFLPTTVWVAMTPDELGRVRSWLCANRSRTARRNAVDDLWESYVWFPTTVGSEVYVPLGHLTRVFAQIDERTPDLAAPQHPNVLFKNSLLRSRNELSGDQVLLVRLASFEADHK